MSFLKWRKAKKCYARLKAFFSYWLARHEVSRLPMPAARRERKGLFSPYIFSKSEIRLMLNKVKVIQRRKLATVSPETFSTLLILQYATEIWMNEALELRSREVDLEESVITLSARMGKPRQIPIGWELSNILRRYIENVNHAQEFLF
jgi:integrase/recombinase XerD